MQVGKNLGTIIIFLHCLAKIGLTEKNISPMVGVGIAIYNGQVKIIPLKNLPKLWTGIFLKTRTLSKIVKIFVGLWQIKRLLGEVEIMKIDFGLHLNIVVKKYRFDGNINGNKYIK